MKFFIVILSFFAGISLVFGQSFERFSVGPEGGMGQTSTGYFSYNLGGLSVSTGTGSTFILTQDFEQPKNYSSSDFNFANAFSPNEDGVNDTWIVRFEENYSDLSIVITNRWGDVMCSVDNYESGSDVWNGQLNNQGPPAVNGTYFYYIESPSGNIRLNGWLQVVR